MKRNLSKILCVLCATFIMSSSLSYGQTVGSVDNISFEEALDMAIKSSNSLRVLENNIDTKKVVSENYTMNEGSIYDSISDVKNKLSIDNQLSISKKDKEIQIESIEYLLKKTILDIEKYEKNIIIKEKTIKNMKNNLHISSIKYENGKISKYDFDVEQDKIKKEEKQLEIDVNNLQNLYNSLDKLLGVTVENRKHVNYQYKYEPLKESEKQISYRAALAFEKDIKSYKIQKTILEKEVNVKLVGLGDDPYRIKELDLAVAENQLLDTKDSMEDKIRGLYYGINKNELLRENLKLELITTDKDLEVANKKLELGKTIPQEVKNLEFKKSQIEENLKLNEIDHALLMLQYEKPYI